MAYVIAEPCIGCKDRSCAEICPVDCIHEGVLEKDGVRYDQLFIHPDDCIDCGLCEPECPVDAIFAGDEVLYRWSGFIAVNAAFYRRAQTRV